MRYEQVNDLKLFLEQLPTGPVSYEFYSMLERLVMKHWHDFHGSDVGGMQPYKILRRMEKASWDAPVLSFIIERHGATVFGSSRAALQCWSLNLESMTATCDAKRYRQLRPRASPLKVEPIAEEIVQCILQNKKHPHITWRKKGGVRVLAAQLLGEGSQQTLNGRRKRLREAIIRLLMPHGWEYVGSSIYKPIEANDTRSLPLKRE